MEIATYSLVLGLAIGIMFGITLGGTLVYWIMKGRK